MKQVFFMMVLFSVFLAVDVTAQEKIVLSNGEWKPFLSKKMKYFGVASHIVFDAFQREGVAVEFKWYGDAWKRAYKDTKDGNVNGSLVWSTTPERLDEMIFSDPVIAGEKDVFFYLKKTSFDWTSIQDLHGKKIGGVLGYTYGAQMDEAIKNGIVGIDWVAREPLNFQKLLKGRIDLFISGKVTGTNMITGTLTAAEAAQITFHPKPVREVTYHLILTKSISDNKLFMDKFNAGLKKLKDEGVYDQYIQDSNAGKYEY